MGDFLVNGVRVELKTLKTTQYDSLAELSDKIGLRINSGRGQAFHIIIDSRKYGEAVGDVLDEALTFAQYLDQDKQLKQVLFLTLDGPVAGQIHGR